VRPQQRKEQGEGGERRSSRRNMQQFRGGMGSGCVMAFSQIDFLRGEVDKLATLGRKLLVVWIL